MNYHVSKPEYARWSVKYVPARGYMVEGPRGEIRGPFGSKDNADTCRDELEARDNLARKKITRPCLCCRKPFESEGIHNRLCAVCRHAGGAYNPHAVAPRNGRPR